MFNSLVLTWERNFEVTFSIFSVLVFQINVIESYLSICFEISYDQKCENCDNLDLLKFTQKNYWGMKIFQEKNIFLPPPSQPYLMTAPLNQGFTNISSLPKSTPQICLILHQFNLYILLIRGKRIGDD